MPDNIPDDIKYKIDKMYECGAGRNVSKYIKSINKNDETDIFEDYVIDLERIKNFKGHIITTHARFLTFSEQFLSNYNIIIDEDIMKSLLPIKTVNLQRIKKLINSNKISVDKRFRLNELIRGLEKDIFLEKPESNISFSEKETSDILKSNGSGNIIEFLSATVVHQTDDNKVQYLVKKTLPRRKILLLSATANESLYKLYFGDDRIKTYSVTDAKYAGKLIQYPSGSFSRNFFEKNSESIANIENMLGDISVITLRSLKKEFKFSTDMNFGNTEGKNELEGTNIGVVGTPHMHPSLYKMYATAFGCNANGHEMKLLEVKHNNYKFWFYTFEDKLLQMLQFWLIESELIQSVGRARLLRFDCTVHLLSNFPLPQAQFDYRKFC